MPFRLEKDSLGEVEVPTEAYYGAQTQRALNNFTIAPQPLPPRFIRALITVKKAAALANQQLGVIDHEVGQAIIEACDQLLLDPHHAKHFPVNMYQTGSGTSTNMNANEVIAHLASQQSGQAIHPNDHVNYGQSSNDVIPTTIHVSAAQALAQQLLPALVSGIQAIQQKSNSLTGLIKTGRTHLMDAMPISFQQSVGAWAQQLEHCRQQIALLQPPLQQLAQGGTAVGTGINTHAEFATVFTQHLSELMDLSFTPAKPAFVAIATQDTVVMLSGQLKALAVALIKIANDLRWMNSGPLAGLAEIQLKPLQPGSSIMPGKVNPVIPEAVLMACIQVIGHDATITLAGQSGNFELNVMLPLIANTILNTIDLLSGSVQSLTEKAIADFVVNEDNINESLARNPILVTALNSLIGYEKAASIAKQAYQQNRPIIDVAEECTDLSREKLQELLDPKKLI